MRRAACVAAAIIAVTLPAAPVAAASGRVSVHDDRTAVNTTLGGTFVFTTTIVNHDRTTVSGLIAHLNVLSFGPGVYVDPEDWSSRRTRYLAPIPPGGSESVTWGLEAVNTGSFGVYVAVLPRSGVARPPVTSPTVHVSVAHRTTIDSGRVLPLVLAVPGALGVLMLLVRRQRRLT